jgi:hypothetical protein
MRNRARPTCSGCCSTMTSSTVVLGLAHAQKVQLSAHGTRPDGSAPKYTKQERGAQTYSIFNILPSEDKEGQAAEYRP